MALQLSQEQASGVSGDYWKVLSIQVLPDDTGCVARVGLYKDQAARAADKSAITTQEHHFTDVCRDADFTAAGDTPAKLVYDKLKTLPEFSGAVDV